MTEEQMVELNNKLALGTATVKFTKADGTERVMLCTTLESLVPVDQLTEHTYTDEMGQPDALVKVYDLEVGGWRSFRPSRVISFE